jgi:hypothetical protein
MISWVRRDDEAIGKLSVNLAHRTEGSAMHAAYVPIFSLCLADTDAIGCNRLASVIQQVMPKSHSIPLSIEYLNQARMVPSLHSHGDKY